jgi:hypothetical protein
VRDLVGGGASKAAPWVQRRGAQASMAQGVSSCTRAYASAHTHCCLATYSLVHRCRRPRYFLALDLSYVPPRSVIVVVGIAIVPIVDTS